MPMIRNNDVCPCQNCVFYEFGKQHPNPNAFDLHYCNRLHRGIVQHKGNAFHSPGTWIIPCGRDMNLFVKRHIATTKSKSNEDYPPFIE